MNFDASQEELFETLKLMIRNDGASYQSGHAGAAVAKSYQEHAVNLLERLREDFVIIHSALKEDTQQWMDSTRGEPE